LLKSFIVLNAYYVCRETMTEIAFISPMTVLIVFLLALIMIYEIDR